MNTTTVPFTDEERIAAEAVDWFLQVEHDDAPLEAVRSWQQWLERSEAHRNAYETVRQTWQALDRISPLPWPKDAEVSRDSYLGETSVSRWLQQSAPPVGTALAPAPASAGTRRGRSLAYGATFLTLAALAFAVLVSQPAPTSYRTETRTGIAEHRDLKLPDGSTIAVGARSQVEVRYSERSRAIRLISGEAFFTVGKDASRPFVVDAGPGRITALGTAFNVRHHDGTLTVEVAEGKVQLESRARSGNVAGDAATDIRRTPLVQGQEAVLDRRGILQPVRQVPSDQVAMWRDGRHYYIDEPLAAVVADLNRYSTQRIVIDDASLASLRITATFFSDDWRGWLDTLQSAASEQRVTVRSDAEAIHISALCAAGDAAPGSNRQCEAR